MWTAHIGRSFRLFETLSSKSISAGELARLTGLHKPAIEAWCSSAIAYQFLSRGSNGKLRLRAALAPILLDKSHPLYLGGQISYLAGRSLQYGELEKLFKYGKLVSGRSSVRVVEEATHWDHYAFMKAVNANRRLHNVMSDGAVFADIGCGTGSLIAKLHEKYPRSTFFGIDTSAKAVSIAKKALKGLPAKIVRMRAEDFRKNAEFDVVYLGESLYAASDKRMVISNCTRSLKVGGTLAIVEGLMPTRAANADDMIIMGMQLDFALHGHKFMSKRELSSLLNVAGLIAIRFEPLGGAVFLVTARK